MTQIKVLVLFGDGINCERETANAFRHFGTSTEIIHINNLLETPKSIHNFDIMAIPGGFSFGDELGSGKLMALKIKHGLMDEFNKFVSEKKPIIGICNGFQVLVKLGLLPFDSPSRELTLTQNDSGNFIDRWIDLRVEQNTVCKWLNRSTLKTISLPIRHGEGNLNTRSDNREQVLKKLERGGNIVLRYSENVNGSLGNIAGVCDDSGLIFGLMPHPEAAFYSATARNLQPDPLSLAPGSHFFETIIKHISKDKVCQQM